MKILVTGAAGYIGSILVPELLKNEHEVVAIDNFMYGQQSLLDCCYNDNLTVIRGDCRDKNLMAKLMNNSDALIPLAAYVGMPLCDKFPIESKSINLDAIKMLIDIRKEFNKDIKIIFPTTNSGYGIGQDGIFCTEKTPLNPISLYGKQKVEAEKLLLEDGNSITLRLATVMGISPRMRLDLLVNDFVNRAVNDRFLVIFEGKFRRNYIHVKDVAKAFVHCINNFDDMKNEAYNVGLSNANLSKLELCQEIKKQLHDFYFIEANVGEDPDKRDYIVSNKKIEKTGFKPDYSLQMSISELIKGYQIIKRNQFANV